MARFGFRVRESQLAAIRQYCKDQAAKIDESEGYVFRRIIFFLSDLLFTDISLQQIQAGFSLLLEMHRNGCCAIKAKTHIKEIICLLKED